MASSPVASAILKVDKSQYPQLFDTVVSSSIDSLQSRVAPRDHTFSAESFGFNPIASQGFAQPVKSARLSKPPRQQPHSLPLQQRPHLASPLQYDIQTVHDPYYKVYKPEEDEPQPEILAALKNNPSVAGYFNKPASTNIEVAHPLKYRKEEAIENLEVDERPNYRPNAYIAGGSRIRRYTDGRKKDSRRKSSHEEEEEEDDPYHYKAEYVSKPKAFDSPAYSSAYKEDKDPNKDYEYPYGAYDSGYDHKEYERIKELSEQQAAEIKQNPGNCKEVIKDGMKCVTCKDPKTKGNYESCSYVTEPKNNKYAYSKERKFDSNDEPDEPEVELKDDASKKTAKYEAPKDEEESPKAYAKLTSSSEPSGKPYSAEDDGSGEKYKGYYVHSSRPKSAGLQAASDDAASEEEKPDSLSKPYNYKQALPGFYTENEPKKDVEHVLAEFKKKDRSSCKKVQKNGMTCFQCIDKSGLKNEECMFVSESAPQRSHLAYQELKEFTSKPATINGNSEEAESQTVTTSSPPPAQKSAAYVVATSGYGKKLKRKKASQGTLATAATNTVTNAALATPAQQPARSRITKRSEQSEGEAAAQIVDETNVAPPEEFAGADSKGAFWAETQPRYSASLGVTLPEFMLARSEHEAYFDETVASA